MIWTDERVETLKRLWAEGVPCSQIGKLTGGFTNNAVIGKARRLNLDPRGNHSRRPPDGSVMQPASVGARRFNVETSSLECVVPARFRVDPPPARHVCSWPIGDPNDPQFSFCRLPASGPFCDEHASVAYRATSRFDTNRAMRALRRHL